MSIDRKFNTNDQQIRAEAFALANSNAPQGTHTELIMAEAQKIYGYICWGLPDGSEMADVVSRIHAVRALRQENEIRKENIRLKKEALGLSEEEAALPDDEDGEVLSEEGSISLEEVETLRAQAEADGAEALAQEGTPVTRLPRKEDDQ